MISDVIAYSVVAAVVVIASIIGLVWCCRSVRSRNAQYRSTEPFHKIDATPGIEEQRQELLRHDKSMFNVMVCCSFQEYCVDVCVTPYARFTTPCMQASSTSDWLIDFEQIQFQEQVCVSVRMCSLSGASHIISAAVSGL